MNRANSGAGQHCNCKLRDHRHINRNPIALAHPARFQDIGELAHFLVKLVVGYDSIFTRFVAFPNNRCLIALGFKMSVKTVVRNICLATFEPLDRDWSYSSIVVETADVVPFLEPVVLGRFFRPERLRVVNRPFVLGFVLV